MKLGHSPVLVSLMVTAAVVLTSCGRQAEPVSTGSWRKIPTPAGPDSGQPNLSTGPAGETYLSWIETDEETGLPALKFAVRKEEKWSESQTIVQGEDLMVNWADYPSLLPLEDGVLAAHWMTLVPGKEGYNINVAFSGDGGGMWSEPVTPHRDNTPTEHGFVSLVSAPGGGVGVLWLDSRKLSEEKGSDSVVAWIGAETEFPLSQAVASGDAFEHRPSERGHCVQDFSTELDLRDLPGEAAEFEFGADDALPTAHLRFYSAALVVPCCRLPGHAPVAADLGNMAIPNGRSTRRLQADHCVLWRWYDHIQGLPIPLPQQISCGRSIVGAVSQKARDRGIQLIQEAG